MYSFLPNISQTLFDSGFVNGLATLSAEVIFVIYYISYLGNFPYQMKFPFGMLVFWQALDSLACIIALLLSQNHVIKDSTI